MTVSDDPVNSTGDALDRRQIASKWARSIGDATSKSGLVFAITGSWGSGKTSLLNMIQEDLESDGRMVLHYNPWLFAGTDQLVTFFFDELSHQLDLGTSKAKFAAERLQRYGALLTPLKIIPVVGSTIAATGEMAAATAKAISSNRGISQERKRVEEALSQLDEPVVVFIDDLDRLTGQEIRDMLRMVRLTAAFPNMIYVLAFDRKRVEQALNEDGLPGRAYLEKIVQVIFDVPRISRHAVQSILFKELNTVLEGTKYSRFNPSLWADTYFDVIDPLIKNIRDVRRYVAPLAATLDALDNQVEAVDALALEALRIFSPDSFSVLSQAIPGLTTAVSYSAGQESQHLKQEVELFVNSDHDNQLVLRAACQRLFPAGARHIGASTYSEGFKKIWLRDRRVASEEVLTYYLEKTMSDDLTAAIASERVFGLLNDKANLEKFFEPLFPDAIESIIANLESFEDKFGEIDVTVGVAVLLNQIPKIDRPRRGMTDFGATLKVERVVLRMLNSVEESDSRLEIVQNALRHITTFSARFSLLELVGHREHTGHKIISETAWREAEEQLKADVRSATPAALARETNLLRLMWWAGMGENDDDENRVWKLTIDHFDDASFCAKLLSVSYAPAHSQAMGSRAVEKHDRLVWDVLVLVCGGEEEVRRCRDQAEAVLGRDDTLVQLADKYLSGWRPERW